MDKPALVQDVMTKDAVSVAPQATLHDCVVLMTRHHVNRLPVVGDNGKVVGMLSNIDVRIRVGLPVLDKKDPQALNKFGEHIKQVLSTTTVRDALHLPPYTCLATDSIVDAAKLMRVSASSGLIVTDKDEHLIGVVTRSDLLDHLITLYEKQ